MLRVRKDASEVECLKRVVVLDVLRPVFKGIVEDGRVGQHLQRCL